MISKGRSLRLSLLGAAVCGAVLALSAGCQTYDFEPVQPLAVSQRTQRETVSATNVRPNVYLLVDSSGSMNIPTDPSDPDCTVGGQLCGPYPKTACNTSVCPTRWSDMQAAMHDFLAANGTSLRMGLAFFPSDNFCGASAAPAVPLNNSPDSDSAGPQATADAIDAQLMGKSPAGGTPTAPSLDFVKTQLAAADTANRPNFVLLLTDGLPNCNAALDKNTCTCTEASGCSGYDNGIGCLDDADTVSQITQLKAATQSISTVVIGFGADLSSGLGAQVLNDMALAGGFPKSCPLGTDAECGANDTCNTSTLVCNTPYYQAANAAELASALSSIGKHITSEPCKYHLDQAPSDPSLLSVLVNGEEIPGCTDATGCDTWTYDAPSQEVDFQGQLCTELQSSTSTNPYEVEFQIVKSL